MPESLNIETTMLFAAIFGVLHVIFTLRVGGYRFRSRISLGDGSWMTDSTKMIQWFEAEHEGPGLIPDDPVQAFLCLLLAGGQINAGTISNH